MFGFCGTFSSHHVLPRNNTFETLLSCPGFGKSDKYTDAENYTHELHTFAVKHLMNELGLGYNVIVVGQDLGGIVGMSVVKDGPEKFSGLVLINSGLPTGFSVDDLIKENPLEVVRTNLPFFVLRATVALFGTSLPIVSPTTINFKFHSIFFPLCTLSLFLASVVY